MAISLTDRVASGFNYLLVKSKDDFHELYCKNKSESSEVILKVNKCSRT